MTDESKAVDVIERALEQATLLAGLYGGNMFADDYAGPTSHEPTRGGTVRLLRELCDSLSSSRARVRMFERSTKGALRDVVEKQAAELESLRSELSSSRTRIAELERHNDLMQSVVMVIANTMPVREVLGGDNALVNIGRRAKELVAELESLRSELSALRLSQRETERKAAEDAYAMGYAHARGNAEYPACQKRYLDKKFGEEPE
jgi:hypothetical protein